MNAAAGVSTHYLSRLSELLSFFYDGSVEERHGNCTIDGLQAGQC